MTRMSNDRFPQDPAGADGAVKATVVIGAIVAAVLLTMTIAGATVRPMPGVDDGSDSPEFLAHQQHLERSGTLASYQILY